MSAERILIVDDEDSIREVVSSMLTSSSFVCTQAQSGKEALALLQSGEEFELMLSDMMMPVMDGAATITVIQRINPSVRIIAASGIDSQDTKDRVVTTGVKHFLAKPFTAETLLLLMREVLDTPVSSTPR